MTLAALKEKYKLESAMYEPNPECKFCNGNGEKPVKRQTGELTFCICLFVESNFSDEIGGLLGSFAKRQLEEMHETETLQRSRDNTRQ